MKWVEDHGAKRSGRRELGFVVRGDITVLSTKDFFGSSAPAIYSFLGGPEMQTHLGRRPRRRARVERRRHAAHRSARRGVDVYPGFGWNAGATVSIAVF